MFIGEACTFEQFGIVARGYIYNTSEEFVEVRFDPFDMDTSQAKYPYLGTGIERISTSCGYAYKVIHCDGLKIGDASEHNIDAAIQHYAKVRSVWILNMAMLAYIPEAASAVELDYSKRNPYDYDYKTIFTETKRLFDKYLDCGFTESDIERMFNLSLSDIHDLLQKDMHFFHEGDIVTVKTDTLCIDGYIIDKSDKALYIAYNPYEAIGRVADMSAEPLIISESDINKVELLYTHNPQAVVEGIVEGRAQYERDRFYLTVIDGLSLHMDLPESDNVDMPKASASVNPAFVDEGEIFKYLKAIVRQYVDEKGLVPCVNMDLGIGLTLQEMQRIFKEES